MINLHKINADVHPGNFLILPDGEMAVLDFGCVRELSEQFVDGYQKSMIDMNDVFFHNNSSQRLFESYKKLQITDKEICSQQFEEKIMPTLRSCYTWLGEIYVEKKFDFKHKKPYPDEAMRTGWAILKRLNGLYSEQFCFDRAHLGLICLLTEIGAEINTDFTRLKCS